MAARSIWNGSIAFAQVVIPVKLFSAVQQQRIQFREVRLSDGSRVSHKRYGSESGEEVPSERIRRAYESSPGHQIILTDEEIAATAGTRSKTIELTEFVKTAEIDPVFYDRPYILAPQAGGERAYRVLHDALERTGKAGIGRFVLRTREQLVALSAHDGALRVYTMRFADELVASAELDAPELDAAASPKEMTMAGRLIDAFAQTWVPENHDNRYRDAVMSVIEQKASGGEVKIAVPVRSEPTPDLLAALQRSLEQKGPRASSSRKPAARKAPTRKTPSKPAAKKPTAAPSERAKKS